MALTKRSPTLTKRRPKQRRLPQISKSSQGMAIRDRNANRIDPPDVGVAPWEQVTLRTDEDCQVVFPRDGFGFILTTTQPHPVAFGTRGHHPFKVTYLRFFARHRKMGLPAKNEATAPAEGETMVPLSLQVSLQSTSGPTGDIHIP